MTNWSYICEITVDSHSLNEHYVPWEMKESRTDEIGDPAGKRDENGLIVSMQNFDSISFPREVTGFMQ